MAINQDLKKLIDQIKFQHGIIQSEIASKMGVKPTYLSDLINGRYPANDAFMNKLRMEFRIDIPEISEHKSFGGSESEPAVMLPLIPMDAIAGFPGEGFESVVLNQCERYAVPEFTSKGADFLIRVSGQSMMPTYNNGDLLACRKISEITFFQWGTVYVLDTNQGVLVKRLFEDKEDPTKIICKSDNFEQYPEFKIQKDGIHSLSIVVGLIRME